MVFLMAAIQFIVSIAIGVYVGCKLTKWYIGLPVTAALAIVANLIIVLTFVGLGWV